MKDTTLHGSQILEICQLRGLGHPNSPATSENSAASWRVELETFSLASFIL
jgi:hypothetical protein